MPTPGADADGPPLELNSQSLDFLEGLYAQYVADPQSAPADWRRLFGRFEGPSAGAAGMVNGAAEAPPTGRPVAADRYAGPGNDASPGVALADVERGARTPATHLIALQERVDQLIRNYRVRGHIVADVDPLDQARPRPPELDPAYYGFTEADYDRLFSTRTLQGPRQRTLREILRWLQNTYCRAIGVQFMHIDDLVIREWLQGRMEETENRTQLTRDEQIRIYRKLVDATSFETFVQTKFIGAKSFSLEGGESLIPLLDLAIEKAGDDGVDEIVLGMAHRGRLNVLANIIGKRAREIFREFMDVDAPTRTGPGDVKYHLGYSGDWTTSRGHKVHLSLSFNPSHLEYVNGVALGRLRAKQDRYGDVHRRRGLAILIHGDAAFAGEGVVQETLNLSELPGYRVGGALHVIVNNQIGFTTTPGEARSSPYATDVARMLQSPIFHVNGEDPEAVAQAVRLALDFRKEFQRDVVIDMYCYRLRGHNEGDEPSFTQPLMYRAIAAQNTVREGYLNRLLNLGGITAEEAEQIAAERHAKLEHEFNEARRKDFQLYNPTPTGPWAHYVGGPAADAGEANTGVALAKLQDLLARLARTPDDFHVHPKLVRAMERRRRMADGREPLDWAAAEALAFATLAADGVRVRLSGQDSQRGTFSQRHAVLHDVETGRKYMPLAHLSPSQGPVEIVNSPLSEAGVLGFDYGYSLDCPEGLIAWEAQFGDFANAAQVVIDQFIASAEAKWNRLSGLVLLLPHGFEGQGPEHSSARLERFLNLAAEDNIQVAYPTTPAQYFHCLRRQVLRRWRKPLVVMTPKSLLRHRECTSTLAELARGRFHLALPESTVRLAEKPDRVLLASGKVYFDLRERREELGLSGPAIIRLEQLYPLPERQLMAALAAAPAGTPIVWVQEEPENMGAWRYLLACWGHRICDRYPISCVSRPASASPATGSRTAHQREQAELVERALVG
ncbi:MAG: 2-oxoglutarate dehydrogenase E1 component [Planctomycetota bacterium]|nr:MAG: 2-oxoglutarate dehydrogenase E1 component [Planctomycetota bacterium]